VVALEFAQPGIRANPMAPGEIETDLVNRLVGKENPQPGRELRQLEQKPVGHQNPGRYCYQ